MKNFEQLGTEIGELVERKNAAYGSSFAKAGAFLGLLYPSGLQPAQYADALLLVRIFDKQMRIATDRDALGESPYLDLAGYGILGAHMHQRKEEAHATWQGSARQDADGESTVQNGSAANDAPTPTTASVDGSSGKSSTPPSRPPSSSTSESPDASAPGATASASVDEAVRDKPDVCAWCGKDVRPRGFRVLFHPKDGVEGLLTACDFACAYAMRESLQ